MLPEETPTGSGSTVVGFTLASVCAGAAGAARTSGGEAGGGLAVVAAGGVGTDGGGAAVVCAGGVPPGLLPAGGAELRAGGA